MKEEFQMRTLKKALSLVLVLAMVFTLAVPALAVDKAADFKDYDKVTNKEAVDVLTAIGVINGNPDGTFGAEGKFTRAQAATMIAYLMLGKTIADALPTGGTQFTDVPANFWGAKYIQYCANEGIINGYGNGKFGPDDELTSTQWSLMLLGALGYEAKNEGIGGTGWEIATTKLAMKAGVASAEDMVGAMTRDTAAKMAFNTLKANMVEYQSNGTNITVGDTNINVGASKAEPVTTTAAYGNNIGKDGVLTGATTTYTVQFGEQHFQDLKLSSGNTGDVDSLGRPASVWTLKNKVDPVATGAASPAVTLIGTTSADNLTKTLKAAGYTLATEVTHTYNSERAWPANKVASNNIYNSWAKNGNIVELYDTNDDKVVDYAVVIDPQMVTVTTVSTAANNAHGAYVTYTAGTIGSGRVYSSVVDADKDVDTAVVTGEVKNGDKVLAYKDQDGQIHIEALTTVSGVLTSVSKSNVATIDGEKYNVAADAEGIAPSKDSNTFYVDARGNVWGAVTSTTGNYAIVMKTEEYSKLDGNKVVKAYNAMLAFADGTYETVEITEDSFKGFKAGQSVDYSVKNGVYTLNSVADYASRKVSVTDITHNSIATGSDVVKYYNNDTKFLVATYTKNADGKEVLSGATLYTGIANVPSYTGLKTAYAMDTSKKVDGVADLVVILDNKSATMADSFVYLTGSYELTVDGRVYTAFIKGEETTVTVGSNKELAQGMYANFNSETSSAPTAATYKTVQAKGGLLTLGSTTKTIAEDAPVYIIDATVADSVSASTTTVSALANKLEGDVYVVNGNNDSVTAVYVVLHK